MESDEEDTKGFFIYYYLDEKKAYDSWFSTIEDAYKSAQSQYNIQKEDWRELNDE
ncbi:MAG TPA: hypothetical protein VK166_14420 [Chitinophagaceae bacterium]|nr:hypothetical protein [Chitinophagaceae bacterium]